MTNEEREQVIDTLTLLSQASAGGARRYWFDLMREQIAARTPEQIEKLERERGLRSQTGANNGW